MEVDTSGLSETLKFIGFILLPRVNPLLLKVVTWERGGNPLILLLRCCEIFYRIRVVNKELEQNYAETTQHDYLLRISKYIYFRC